MNRTWELGYHGYAYSDALRDGEQLPQGGHDLHIGAVLGAIFLDGEFRKPQDGSMRS